MRRLKDANRAAAAADLNPDQLEKILQKLDALNRVLNVFLEHKRDNFSRFYFIGDEDLLEIIGQASEDAIIIQAHLKKLFQGVHSVVFDGSNTKIIAVCSSLGERVDLKNPIICQGPVEEWLMTLSNEVSDTLKAILTEMIKTKPNKDYFKYPSQLTLLYHQIRFTAMVEKVKDVDKLSKYVEDTLMDLVSCDTQDELQRYTARSLIIEFVRFRQVVDDLRNPGMWNWKKQLRFYFRSGICYAEMGDSVIPYGYEYQGNPQRLVYTNLTAKCYLTLCEGISLGYGGNPYGPAGTGKTESVKALGQALGRQVLVFNCDEAIDVQSMCRIFTGLVMGGAWGCFDEFNRLDEEVLSALSQQIQVIQTAILNKASNVELLGRNINVNPNAGIYVTLNPAGKGYGGRSKLPSNLTALFRAVAMSAPDNELIAEVLMYSQGFKCARALSKQIVLVFALCKQLLSPEIHYDWGLRSLKSILSTAEQWMNNMDGDVDEPALLVKALRVSTLSKLTFADRVAFEQIISDVFPNVQINKVEEFELRTAASEVIKEMKIVELPHQVDKMLQMWESINQRTGVVLTGPSGCGKTTLWTLLQKTLDKIGVKVDIEVMNPKSMPRQRLLGRVDYDTREWFDGVLTRAARRAVASSNRTWIVCDGDIDPEWIESLNSVLDDNRLLTLPNGERIQFDSKVNFVFESHSLEHASPATVSRMAVILLAPEDLTVENVCTAWVNKWPKDSRVPYLMEQLFYRTIDALVKKSNSFVIGSTTFGLTTTVLSHLNLISGNSDSEFINALIRGSVCILPPQEQPAFAADIYKWANQLGLSTTGIDPANILDQYWNGSTLQLFDFHPAPPTVPAIDSSSLPLVSTTEVQRTIHTIKNWIETGQPMMLVGPRGSGKTTVLTHLFKLLPSTTTIVLNCSAQTDAASLMTKLMQQCTIASTASGQVLRPRNTEKALVFFKNFDLPRPDKWGTVQLVSFMQQILTHGGFYNEELQWITLERIQFVFSMSSAEKRPISPRFTSIIRIAAMHNTEASQLQVIYSHYLTEILKKTDYNDNSKVQAVAAAMVRVFQKFSTGFSIDEYPHYDFTYRDITRWVVQLQRYIHNSNTFTPNIIIYEGIKHFANRLSSLSDRTRMIKEIKQIFRDNLPIFEETDFEYCNYQIDTNDKAPLYLVQMERQTAQEAFQKLIVSYEREMGHLDIFRMQDTEWLANVLTATIAMPSSNIVAITVPGLFFTEILRVICHSNGIEIYSPPMLADFSNATFMAFLKDLIPKVTGKDEEVVLLMEDFMFVDNAILDALNSLMASGEVGGLFSQTEFDSLVASIQGELRESNTNMTPQEFYCAKVRRLIHVVIVLNPEHSAFRSFFNFAPSFVSDASIIWATELSQQSLMTIPRQILLQEGDSALNSDNLTKLNPMFASTFQAVKEAPIKYSEFLRLYLNLFNKKQKELAEKKGRLDIGLAKLNEAAKTVDTLSGEIQAKKTVLSGKEKDANDAMERIKKAVAECSSQQTKIEKMQGTLSEEEKFLQSEQTKIEAELGTIQPEIDAALEAVGKIRREHLAEVRALAKPPQAISEVMSGVLMMLGENELSWASIKKIMGSDNFTNRIMKFDAKSLTPEIINNVARHLKQKGMFFEDATIRKASQAVAPLAQWVKANVRFFSVLEKVEPLRQKNEQYASEIQKKRLTLKELQDKKAKVDKQVAEFQEQFRITTKEAQQLKNEVSLAEQNLHDAEQLFSKLKDERTRWDTQRNQISAMLTSLPKEVLLAAAVGTFCGPFPEDERKKMVSLWLPIAKQAPDATFNMGKFMYTESELMALRGSLSGDALSLENAVIITNAVTVPLIIDPTNKALDWLVNNIQKNGGQPTVLPRGHERFASELALAVRFGKTLIITEIDSIDAILIPLIRKDLIFSGSRPAIKVGDREIDYNEKFTLYLLTREPQPQLHPTAAAHVAVVNFSVTRAGLESTLLSLTLEREQPEIQAERSKYIANEEEMKATLSDLEVTLLKTLVEADSGNILQNTSLIETLNKTKEQAAAVAESLEKIESLSKKLEEKANTYRSLAQLGASLFFAIDGLSKLDHMYRFSSTLFMTLFTSIFDAKVNANGVHRTLKFESELVRIIFRHVSNSMFNKYRTAAALHIVASCYKNLVDATQYQFLINSPVSTGDAPSWVPETRRQAFCGFAKAMPELVQTLKMRDPTAGDVWADWLKQSHPEENLPIIDGQQVSKRGLTPFAQLLIVGMLVPHRLVAAIQAFVTEALGLGQFSVPFEYNQIVSDKTGLPMIFITSPGADPSHEVVSVAKRANVSLTEVAVGSDTPDATVAKLKKCAEEGTWFMLKNTHLSISLVARLEKEIASLQTKKEGFRVFFTTEPHRSFPPLLLANSIKVAVEAPPGVKANLTRTIAQIDTKSMQPQQLKLAAAVAYFHSIIQERRTYIPQGWTKFYEFSTADFSCAMQIIQKTKEADAEALEYIRGLLCLAVYGGRVDNDFDFNVLSLYLQEFLNDKKNPLRLDNNAQMSNVMKYVERMTERDDPSLFMLPPNATKTVAISQMNETITSLRRLSSIVSDSGSISRAQWIDKFTPLLQRWQDLRRKYPNMTVQRQNSPFDDTPMAAALYSQCCVIHQLVDDLEEYFKMVDGFLNHGDTLSHQLQSLGRSLIAGEVPDAWSDIAEGPSVASEWLQEVARKVEYIDALAADPSMVSKGIELGAVLRPTALLDALRQQTARETGTPMVDLKLTFSFSESKERAIYVTDLALQGAVFQGLKIAPMTKDEQVLVKCSKCSFSWEKERKNDGIAMIPLYSNSNREKFIVTVPAPCSEITSKDASKVFSFAGTAFIIGSN
ncbi:Dynein heavy chain family protein [Trichomonas vaginalis G3]|uniref:Dynein heavy chain family protein n=2 Tax=Trichomonas vaginalis (strain ATCC PRA-98 / G3) TaxID=412133 RepID=A2FH76_TRIV3|nr:Dynein heavy chain family protein [Trichomonas vaginalis G3]|eukprot:XP_001308688.1 Dynein heavy chain family protein [Trichomonas vaginalis G3]